MSDLAYTVGDNLYLNVTNRCTNQCSFCIRNKAPLFNQEHPLWLKQEPSTAEVLKAIGNPSRYKEIVFCGYGEPLVRLDLVKEVAKQVRAQYPHPLSPSPIGRGGVTTNQTGRKKPGEGFCPPIRLNTNGTANLFWGKNVLPEIVGLIDVISISLNSADPEQYRQLCHPAFGDQAFPAILEFIKEAVKVIPRVEVTAVEMPGVDLDKCRQLASALDAAFRLRPYYESSYVR